MMSDHGLLPNKVGVAAQVAGKSGVGYIGPNGHDTWAVSQDMKGVFSVSVAQWVDVILSDLSSAKQGFGGESIVRS